MNSLQTKVIPTWCPGCGNYLIMASLKKSFSNLKIGSHKLALVYDIGCAGNMADFLKTYGVHALHGRTIPVALGIKCFNPKLKVVVIGGDGGIYGEGLNHLVTAARNNENITVLVSNNRLYSLTTGQASPTAPKGTISKSTAQGTKGKSLSPVALIKNINPQAQSFSVQIDKQQNLVEKIDKAIKFSGFSLVDICQKCIAFGK